MAQSVSTPNISAADVMQKHGGRLKFLREFLNETGCFSPALTKLARQFVDFNCPGDGVIEFDHRTRAQSRQPRESDR